MASGRIDTMDIHELMRLFRAGDSDRQIARLLGHNRRTVARYRSWATEQGLLQGELPSVAELHCRLTTTLPPPVPPQQVSSVAAYAEEIAQLRARGVEIAAIRARLEERHGPPISYSAVWRLVRRLEPTVPEAMVRVEVLPGAEGQVDFGYGGLLLDPVSGTPRRSWVFVVVLSFSRHLYAELVFDQRVETWLSCHIHAFTFFGGVPERMVPDNLKTAIIRASFRDDPLAQRAYRELAEHYGFRIDPTPPRQPHLKGKVEQGGVHYVKRNFLAGRDPETSDERNRRLRTWLLDTAGVRIHGTTKVPPLVRFRDVEQMALLPVPRTPFDVAVWKQVRVYRDCYVVFEGSYYSAPYRLVGQTLWVRGGLRRVELYTTTHELIATHTRAKGPGDRQTHLDHLPPSKIPGLVLSRESVQLQANQLGPATAAVVCQLLAHRPEDRLRSAGRLVRLAETYGRDRLERACRRAQHFGETSYPAVKRILDAGLEGQSVDRTVSSSHPRVYTFVRQASEFVTSLVGGTR
jgi:transposase